MKRRRMPTRELKLIQSAFDRESRIEGDNVVVPDDFFERLNAQLNPKPRVSIIDMLLGDERQK